MNCKSIDSKGSYCDPVTGLLAVAGLTFLVVGILSHLQIIKGLSPTMPYSFMAVGGLALISLMILKVEARCRDKKVTEPTEPVDVLWDDTIKETLQASYNINLESFRILSSTANPKEGKIFLKLKDQDEFEIFCPNLDDNKGYYYVRCFAILGRGFTEINKELLDKLSEVSCRFNYRTLQTKDIGSNDQIFFFTVGKTKLIEINYLNKTPYEFVHEFLNKMQDHLVKRK